MHGGDLQAASARYGFEESQWLDLSTGINPHVYPFDPIAQKHWQRLPEVSTSLLNAAAQYYGTNEFVLTPGSQWSIHFLPTLLAETGLQVERVAISAPAYAEHAYHWQKFKASIVHYHGLPADSVLDAAELCVVINPHNPLGYCYTREQICDLAGRARRHGCMLVIDEAFMDASPEHSVTPLAAEQGVIVLRSLGKFFGLAGLRLGAIAAEASILSHVGAQMPIWSLSGPSLAVAEQALVDQLWQVKMRSRLALESERLAAMLSKLEVGEVRGSALFQTLALTSQQHAAHVHEQLAQQAIWVRHIENTSLLRFGLPGREAGWIQLEAALQNALNGQQETTYEGNNAFSI